MERKLQRFLNDIDVPQHYVKKYFKQNMYDTCLITSYKTIHI
jgi:hypothetical protein